MRNAWTLVVCKAFVEVEFAAEGESVQVDLLIVSVHHVIDTMN